jgi:hypothetical protein
MTGSPPMRCNVFRFDKQCRFDASARPVLRITDHYTECVFFRQNDPNDPIVWMDAILPQQSR